MLLLLSNSSRRGLTNLLLSNVHRYCQYYPVIKAAAEMSSCQIAVCQLTANEDKENNYKIVERLVKKAAADNAKVIFLPEACDYIETSFPRTKQAAEPLTGTLMTKYKDLAKLLNVWLSIGGFHELTDSQLYNSHVLIDDLGTIRSVYRKTHLFDVAIPEKNVYLNESDVVTAGSKISQPIDTPAGLLALSICYDLRFPEIGVIQRKIGNAHILTYPSAFTNATGRDHWEVLLRARAIETQCYVVAAAQYGRHNDKRISYGQSMIIDPWGRILAECPKYEDGIDLNESIAVATIDQTVIAQVRREMPVFQHRRNDLYRLELMHSDTIIDDNESYKFAHKIIPGSTVFLRTKYSFAFTNIRCVVPGHVLVSSLRHAPRLEDLTSEELSDLFQTVVRVQKAVETIRASTSSTVCCQDGKDAGQTIPHVHVHIMPRLLDDFVQNDDIYSELAKHDRSDNSSPIRSLEEMSEEAKELRKQFL